MILSEIYCADVCIIQYVVAYFKMSEEFKERKRLKWRDRPNNPAFRQWETASTRGAEAETRRAAGL